MKSAALQDIHKPVRRILEDALLEHITPEDYDLPKACNLRRMANKVRANKRQEEPKDLNFHLHMHELQKFVYLYYIFHLHFRLTFIEYLQCEDFLIRDVRVDDQRHLMFATPAQLRLIRYALRWYYDGSFNVTHQTFTQLWSTMRSSGEETVTSRFHSCLS